MNRRAVGIVLGSLAFSLPILAGENEWFTYDASGGDKIKDVSCPGVTGDAGAAIEFDHGVNSKSIQSLGVWGARWFGSRWPVCDVLTPDVVSEDTVVHSYDEEGTSDNETLTVDQSTQPWVSGRARQMDNTTDWWWTPSVTVVDQPPEYWVYVNGNWETQGWDDPDENNTTGTSTNSWTYIPDDPLMPGHAAMVPVASGTNGSYIADKTLDEGPGGMIQVDFKLWCSVNRSLDNAVLMQWVQGLTYDAQTSVQ